MVSNLYLPTHRKWMPNLVFVTLFRHFNVQVVRAPAFATNLVTIWSPIYGCFGKAEWHYIRQHVNISKVYKRNG